MKIHEYQAKELFKQSGIPVPRGQLVVSPDQASNAALTVQGPPWVVKAQVHTGGRGKGGGVKVVHDPYQVVAAVETMLANPLVTKQTGAQGVKVNQVLVEEGVEIEHEFYLGMVIDRTLGMPTMIFSQAGGMEIEEVADRSPELILKEAADPLSAGCLLRAETLFIDSIPCPLQVPFAA